MRDDPASFREPGRADLDPRAVAVLVHDGVTAFELGVACDVFGDYGAGAAPGQPWYRLSVCGLTAGPMTTDSAFRILPAHGPEQVAAAGTVIVLPAVSPEQVPAELPGILRQAHERGSRIVSLCTGAFALGAAGLLDGRRATTHWEECAELARRYPLATVDPDVLFTDEGDILTSAGSAASIDLCLHLVRTDYGAEIATRVARQLVVPPQRDGGQAQYIDAPMPDSDGDGLFAGTLDWLQGHLDEPVTVEDLAVRAAMSPRTFARRFVASTGTTPYQWVARERVRLAQRLLETTDLPVEAIARDCGLGSAANLRKQFSRALATSPQAYRRTFAAMAG
jgi:AraC family transcriptional activator FtrA